MARCPSVPMPHEPCSRSCAGNSACTEETVTAATNPSLALTNWTRPGRKPGVARRLQTDPPSVVRLTEPEHVARHDDPADEANRAVQELDVRVQLRRRAPVGAAAVCAVVVTASGTTTLAKTVASAGSLPAPELRSPDPPRSFTTHGTLAGARALRRHLSSSRRAGTGDRPAAQGVGLPRGAGFRRPGDGRIARWLCTLTRRDLAPASH